MKTNRLIVAAALIGVAFSSCTTSALARTYRAVGTTKTYGTLADCLAVNTTCVVEGRTSGAASGQHAPKPNMPGDTDGDGAHAQGKGFGLQGFHYVNRATTTSGGGSTAGNGVIQQHAASVDPKCSVRASDPAIKISAEQEATACSRFGAGKVSVRGSTVAQRVTTACFTRGGTLSSPPCTSKQILVYVYTQ